MKRHSERNKTIYLIVLSVACTIMLVTINIFTFVSPFKDGANIFGVITPNTAKGFLQAILCLLCMVLVYVDRKIGGLIAIQFLGFTSIFMIIGFVKATLSTPDHTSGLIILPGVAYVICSYIALHLMIIKIKEAENRSVTDRITGLFNRIGFEDEVNKRIEQHKVQAVIFMQIKEFRDINDELGHSYGDTVLRIVGERLKSLLGKEYVLCRIDGTVFAIAVPFGKDIQKTCDDISEEITRKVTLITLEMQNSSIDCYLSPYFGISIFSEETCTATRMMQHADKAVYSAAKNKKGRVCFFSDEINKEEAAQNETLRKIQESLDKGYFYLVYQPQYTAKEKKLRGFETLIRCNYQFKTPMYPGEFIPAAEATNLIKDIDLYVLRRALTEFKPVLDGAKEKFMLSINVSAKSMSSEDFVQVISNLLSETRFPAEWLEIEITEYSFAESEMQTTANVNALRAMNVKIALDDFGTGYTSLAQILKLPVNLLKIDKSLVDDVVNSRVNRDFVDSVIYMGHLIGCEVIAEGVEDEKQLNMLQQRDCDFIQGFIWDRPLEFKDALKRVD